MKKEPQILVAFENEKLKNSIEYTFDLLFSILGLDYKIISFQEKNIPEDVLVITYSEERSQLDIKNHIHIYESGFFGENYLKFESLPQLPLERYDDLPIIFRGENKIEGHIKKSKNLIETDIDIIASSFFMVSRYEEVILGHRDKYDRFPVDSSLAYKGKFLDRPIVNEYIELLWIWIDSFNLGVKRKKFWSNKDFAVCLTHDIDEVKRYRFYPPLGAMFRATKKKKFKKMIIILFDYLKTKLLLKEDIYHGTFDYIMSLEKERGFNSSFYFRADGKEYSLDAPFFKKIVTKLKKENFEIGIHPSFDSYNNLDGLKKEKERLEKIIKEKIVGGRQHYLKYKIPDSWIVWEKAGLKYNSTIGFADYEGFRCGICHPFKPFNVIKNKIINLWEVPLIVMDGTLSSRKLSLEEARKILINLLGVVEKHNGIFVLLWHNSYMTDLFTPEWKECFEELYTSIANKNCLVSSAKELLNSWEESLAPLI